MMNHDALGALGALALLAGIGVGAALGIGARHRCRMRRRAVGRNRVGDLCGGAGSGGVDVLIVAPLATLYRTGNGRRGMTSAAVAVGIEPHKT